MSKDMKNIFISTAHQRVLEFLCDHPTGRFYDRELARKVKNVSRASVNNVLRDLSKANLIRRKREGKQVYNSLNLDHPLVRKFKSFLNILKMFPFLEDLKSVTDKIILYGSIVDGSNKEDSDIDVFVVSDEPFGKIQKIVDRYKLESRLQLVIKTKAEYLTLKDKEPVFYEEVHRGIIYHG